ncbi:MAG: hypothetical protein KGL53_01930 [Elusimicrobia bacterium]|nr:hypothetical protein [Elusimicrobiota bacterium]
MRSAALLVLALASACGARTDFEHARSLESRGEPLEAVKAYDGFVKDHPQDRRVQEAEYRAGMLYARVMHRCPEARHDLEAAARADGAWAEPARQALMSCPDYFPIPEGARWTYVDSLSGGKNMRLELAVKVSSADAAGVVTGAFYAGTQLFRDYKRAYRKQDWSVWEDEEGVDSPILRWPYAEGRTWTVPRKGGDVTYTIVSDRAVVDVKAGRFTRCLKVRSQTAGYPSWVFDYYCPGVGRVKTTVGVPGAENPNTELSKTTLTEER